MEWNIGNAAGIYPAAMLHHFQMAAVKRMLHVQVAVFVLTKQYFTMEYALMLLYVQVRIII